MSHVPNSKILSAKQMPSHTTLKTRNDLGQGERPDDREERDRVERNQQLKQQLLEREKKSLELKSKGKSILEEEMAEVKATTLPKKIEESKKRKNIDDDDTDSSDDDSESDSEDDSNSQLAKRARYEEESDADDSDDDSDDDSEDEEQLLRELEKIKKEKALQQAKDLQEQEKQKQEEKERFAMNSRLDDESYELKKNWMDDGVFKNQANNEPVLKKKFINDTTRNDFAKKFLTKYIK